MAWSEMSSGHWERPLGANEMLVKKIGSFGQSYGHDHLSISISASFRGHGSWAGDDLSVMLRKGWMALRFHHPSIATALDNDTLRYEIPDAESLKTWAEETFIVVEDKNITPADITADAKPDDLFTARYLPHHATILFQTPHWRTDAIGAFQLLNAFFESATTLSAREPFDLPWGQEHVRLTSNIEAALGIPESPTSNTKATVDQIIADEASMGPGVGIECIGNGTTMARRSRSARLRLPELQTRMIIDACEDTGIGLTAAVYATVAVINHSFASSETKGNQYKSTLGFGLRSHLSFSSDASDYTPALCVGRVGIGVPESQSWVENAERYHDLCATGLSNECLQARGHYAHTMLETLQKTKNGHNHLASEIDVWTVEDADCIVRWSHQDKNKQVEVEVTDINLGVKSMTRESYCCFWVFRERLEFNLVYNEAFHDPSQIEDLLGRLPKILMLNLHLKE